MYGFSVFLNETLSEATFSYMEKMMESGFRGIFTSIHIPEDDHNKYGDGLQKLGHFAKERQLELMVDISGSALQRLGFSFENVAPLQEMGLTGIRMDYGIPAEVIAQVSRKMNVALNASTITEQDLQELHHYDADFSRMEAWHNYYPRPETGLGKKSFRQQNEWLKNADFTVMAFVPGDGKRRGPLYNGLPTLEKHRDSHPLAAALELGRDCGVDKVYVGDPDLQVRTRRQFALYEKEKKLLFYARPYSEGDHADGIAGTHTNRFDAARDVIRSADSRLQSVTPVPGKHTVKRKCGSITLDNEKYGRYAGEVQITKRSLPADDRVNVVGSVRKEDLSLLAWCGAGQPFQIEWLEGE